MRLLVLGHVQSNEGLLCFTVDILSHLLCQLSLPCTAREGGGGLYCTYNIQPQHNTVHTTYNHRTILYNTAYKHRTILYIQHTTTRQYCTYSIQAQDNTVHTTYSHSTILYIQHTTTGQYCTYNIQPQDNTIHTTYNHRTVLYIQHTSTAQYLIQALDSVTGDGTTHGTTTLPYPPSPPYQSLPLPPCPLSYSPIPDDPRKRNTRGCCSSVQPSSFRRMAAATVLMAPFWPTRRSLRRSSIGNLLRSSSLLCSRSAAYYTRTDRCEQTATVGQLNNNVLCVTHMHKLYDNPISSTREKSTSSRQVTFSSLMCETCSEPFTQLWELLLT